jgi:alpha-N-arabinofuranosidase
MKPTRSLYTVLLLGISSVTNGIAGPMELKLDTTRTGAPISPYIYGQFVEHLGRCIYGGIWSQMLEDRKFYFPITADYSPYRDLTNSAFPVVGASPWQILGPSAGVALV